MGNKLGPHQLKMMNNCNKNKSSQNNSKINKKQNNRIKAKKMIN